MQCSWLIEFACLLASQSPRRDRRGDRRAACSLGSAASPLFNSVPFLLSPPLACLPFSRVSVLRARALVLSATGELWPYLGIGAWLCFSACRSGAAQRGGGRGKRTRCSSRRSAVAAAGRLRRWNHNGAFTLGATLGLSKFGLALGGVLVHLRAMSYVPVVEC